MSSQQRSEPIDAVITWVDGEDPVHQQKLEAYLGWRAKRRPRAAAPTRYADRGELEYCLASLLRFAPWLRHIFIVTDEQTPGFLSQLPAEIGDRVSVVDHKTVFRGVTDKLPTFNSLSIETVLWRIPGLANNFIYLNDDFFLIKPVQPDQFFRDGKVVLIGSFRPLMKPGLEKKLKRAFGLGRPTQRMLQSEAATLAGVTEHFLDVDHIPHPMRVSTFHDYFSAHPQLMRRNASFPLRNISQFWPISLANHLEIKRNSVEISSVPTLLYLTSSSGKLQDIDALLEAESRPECRFLCAQSLDNASEAFMDLWVSWMDRVIGRLPKEPA
jgi:hypothetical protein